MKNKIFKRKNNIQENIIVHVKQNDLDDATVKINDGKLKFEKQKLVTSLLKNIYKVV